MKSRVKIKTLFTTAIFATLVGSAAFAKVESTTNYPRIMVSKKKTLVDRELDIKLKGLQPQQNVTLTARTQDIMGRTWSSSANFQADNSGKVRLRDVAPISGSYQVAHSMGLFWSLQPEGVPSPESIIFEANWPITVELTMESNGYVLDTETVKRTLIKKKKVERTPIENEGFVGTLFTSKDDEDEQPVVVVLGGSRGGLDENVASVLASNGVATLALAYFGIDPLPEGLENLPLEYFESVFQWLSNQPGIDGNNIYVLGRSKGGEAALLLGATFPQYVKKVIAYVPSHVVWQGLADFEVPASSWTQGGTPLPFVPFFCLPEDFQVFPISLLPCHQRALDNFPATVIDPARIPVENINGPVLLISGTDDKLWPSFSMADEVIARLDANQHPFSFTHLKFQDAGHFFDIPFIPAGTTVLNGLALGGSSETNGIAAYSSWFEVVDFIKEEAKRIPASIRRIN